MDNMLVFNKEKGIDDKGRIILKNCGIKQQERVFLFYSKNHDYLIVRDQESVVKLRQRYEKMDAIQKEEEYDRIIEFFLNCVGEVKLDNQYRFTLGSDVCSEVNMGTVAVVVGCLDELRIYPKETYKSLLVDNAKGKEIKKELL